MPIFRKLDPMSLTTNTEEEELFSGHVIHGLRLSPNKKITTGRLTKILHKLGLTITDLRNFTGLNLKDYVALNPTWSERMFGDLCIENIDSIKDCEKWSGR